jgi:hypothetical protein
MTLHRILFGFRKQVSNLQPWLPGTTRRSNSCSWRVIPWTHGTSASQLVELTIYRSGTKKKGGRHAGHMSPDGWVLHFRPEAQPGFLGLCIPSPFCTPVQQLWKVMVTYFMLFKNRCSLTGLSSASATSAPRPSWLETQDSFWPLLLLLKIILAFP